jgi:Na+/citrate or Na+/malate symporter
VIGDGLCYFFITIVGFMTHDTLSATNIDRLLITFLTFFVAWLLISPWLGLFQREILISQSGLWRPALAALYAAPMGGWLRSFALGTPMQATFTLVMAVISALALTLWRTLFRAFIRRQS